MKIRQTKVMIIGKVSKNEEMVRFDIKIHCTKCKKRVPGGIKTGKKHSQTAAFRAELESFKKSYLCGICRDKERTG